MTGVDLENHKCNKLDVCSLLVLVVQLSRAIQFIAALQISTGSKLIARKKKLNDYAILSIHHFEQSCLYSLFLSSIVRWMRGGILAHF
jgi:hypothetical protein